MDVLTLLQRGGGASRLIESRVERIGADRVCITIVTYEEQTRGWLERISRCTTQADLIVAYSRLHHHFRRFSEIEMLPFDEAAAIQFQQLRVRKLRVGTADLRIAAIALANHAGLVTRNTADFRRIGDLTSECWIRFDSGAVPSCRGRGLTDSPATRSPHEPHTAARKTITSCSTISYAPSVGAAAGGELR